MQSRRQRSRRQRRIARRVNIGVPAGYAVIVVLTALLKAWETASGEPPIGRLAKTNVIIWDTITLAATLGALALGVREMVLAYFMRKEYEEDLDALLENQREQAEMVNQQAETARQQAEMVQAFLADAREQREAEAARAERDAALRQEQAERDAALRREQAERDAAQIQQLTNTVQQLIEQNRLLMERIDRRNNGRDTEPQS